MACRCLCLPVRLHACLWALRHSIVPILCCLMVLAFANKAVAKAPSPSLDSMIGQMLMVGFRGLDETSSDVQGVLKRIEDGHLGGVIYFEYDVTTKTPLRNIHSLEQVKNLSARLQKKAKIPLFIAIDQEGGRVRRLKPPRLPIMELPSPKTMGKGTEQATYNWGLVTGKLLKDLGINLNFAPSVDCDVYPKSPAIGALDRAFAKEPTLVAKHARQFAHGMAKHGIISSYKHFPGHGSARTDTHLDLTDITDTWSEAELLPYLEENRPTTPMMVMVGHLFNKKLDPDFPATLSYAMLNNLLRKRLNWQGVIVTDDMQMQAIGKMFSQKEALQHAINAGVDLIVAGNNVLYDSSIAESMHNDIARLVHEGKVTKERIYESYQRIINLKQQAGLMPIVH